MTIELDNIYNINCLDGLKDIPDEFVDAVVTSPPYDALRTYDGFSFDFHGIAQQLYRVLKNGGVCVWVVADGTVNGGETGTSFRQALYFMEIGFTLHDTMIYQKHNPTPNTGNGCRYQQCFEYMFVLSKGKPKTVNLLTEQRRNSCNDRRTERPIRRQRNVDGEFEEVHKYVIKQTVPRQNIWNYKVGMHNTTSDKIAFKHPAIFPEQLAIDHILSWTNEEDIVLDPFMGSGTTAKAALLTNRHYIGFEISDNYCEIARQRLLNSESDGYEYEQNNLEQKHTKKLF